MSTAERSGPPPPPRVGEQAGSRPRGAQAHSSGVAEEAGSRPRDAQPHTSRVAETGQRRYQPRLAFFWWLRRRSYLAFVVRELSSVFVAWFVVFLLLLVHAVGRGEDAYQRFLSWSANPLVVALNVVALFFVTFHAVTWFNLAPRAMAVRIRGRRVPPRLVAAGHYLAWALASVLVIWLLLR